MRLLLCKLDAVVAPGSFLFFGREIVRCIQVFQFYAEIVKFGLNLITTENLVRGTKGKESIFLKRGSGDMPPTVEGNVP